MSDEEGNQLHRDFIDGHAGIANPGAPVGSLDWMLADRQEKDRLFQQRMQEDNQRAMREAAAAKEPPPPEKKPEPSEPYDFNSKPLDPNGPEDVVDDYWFRGGVIASSLYAVKRHLPAVGAGLVTQLAITGLFLLAGGEITGGHFSGVDVAGITIDPDTLRTASFAATFAAGAATSFVVTLKDRMPLWRRALETGLGGAAGLTGMWVAMGGLVLLSERMNGYLALHPMPPPPAPTGPAGEFHFMP